MPTIIKLEDASLGYSDTLVREHFDWSVAPTAVARRH